MTEKTSVLIAGALWLGRRLAIQLILAQFAVLVSVANKLGKDALVGLVAQELVLATGYVGLQHRRHGIGSIAGKIIAETKGFVVATDAIFVAIAVPLKWNALSIVANVPMSWTALAVPVIDDRLRIRCSVPRTVSLVRAITTVGLAIASPSRLYARTMGTPKLVDATVFDRAFVLVASVATILVAIATPDLVDASTDTALELIGGALLVGRVCDCSWWW